METLLQKNQLDNYISELPDEILKGDFDVIFKNAPVTVQAETSCGFGFFRGKFLQKFANKKCFILVFGIVGLIFASSHAYYNGTISTMEKRFKISSRNMGFISTGNDITSFLISSFVAYYGGKGHRPRWMAFGIVTIIMYCLLNYLPHALYGPGQDALALTLEHGAKTDEEQTKVALENSNKKALCLRNVTDSEVIPCQSNDGNIVAQLCLFGAQLVAGVGQSLKHTLGISYLDDNIKKSKTPALISFSYFIRLLGPAAGYALASLSLKTYIAPDLTPVIDNKDPRWIGAWYLGWILIAAALSVFTFVMAFFPKELPRAAVRRRIQKEIERRNNKSKLILAEENKEDETSIRDFILTFKRIISNKLFMFNNFAGIFYVFGFMPFWIYSPKLIETLFRQSASSSSLFTGTFALVASALGLLVAGGIISKFQPSARHLALWNVIVGVVSCMCIVSFSFLGCEESKNAVKTDFVFKSEPSCISECAGSCDFVKYNPVCGADGVTYISACHAGCGTVSMRNSTKTFGQCSCLEMPSSNTSFAHHIAKPGPCPIDCKTKLYIFLVIMCIMKFIGASGRASNFLVGVRCVEERDKTLALGFGMSLVRLLASVPSPIFFGYLIDNACQIWGKTCTSKGNCWLYDGELLRYRFFYASAFSIAIGTIFDCLVWKHSKDLKIFDEKEVKLDEKKQNQEL